MSSEPESDLKTMLDASGDFVRPKRGDLRTGKVLAVDEQGLIVDLGLKRDGVVLRADLEKLAEEGVNFEPGQQVPVMIISPVDYSGNMVVSIYQARRVQDWMTAEQYLASGEIFEAEVIGHNRGGLLVPFGDLRAFVPASHVTTVPHGLNEAARLARLLELVGKKYPFKVIEVNRSRRRLVLSQREAQREWRDRQKARLLEELVEGQRCKGEVSGMRDFGAFVDLGGADGLIHISELSWRRVKHPREVLKVGDQVEVLVIRLDHKGKRIGLSLKQLQPDPWEHVGEQLAVEQTPRGIVTRIVSFGAFVELMEGIEGLLPGSQIGEGLSSLHEGQSIRVRIVSLEPGRRRIGLRLLEIIEPDPDPVSDPALEAAQVSNQVDEALDAVETNGQGAEEDSEA